MFHRYDYEAEFYPALSRLPLDLRRKLDVTGIKISLKHWLAYSMEERAVLCHLPCDSDDEKEVFRRYLDFLSGKYHGPTGRKNRGHERGAMERRGGARSRRRAVSVAVRVCHPRRMAPLAIASPLWSIQDCGLESQPEAFEQVLRQLRKLFELRCDYKPAMKSNDTSLSRVVPFGLIGQTKPHHYRDMLRVLWENRKEIPYAWNILNHGVCDGCSLGPYGLRDNVLDGVHLCMTRLKLLKLNTMAALDMARMSDVERLKRMKPERLRSLGRLPYPMIRRKGAARIHAHRLGRRARRRLQIDPRDRAP